MLSLENDSFFNVPTAIRTIPGPKPANDWKLPALWQKSGC
jgi:hypothetical protein